MYPKPVFAFVYFRDPPYFSSPVLLPLLSIDSTGNGGG
jgi:hypothetical protein